MTLVAPLNDQDLLGFGPWARRFVLLVLRSQFPAAEAGFLERL
jgi:hypothetical protein